MNVQGKIRELRRRVEREAAEQVGAGGRADHLLEELEVFRSSSLRAESMSESVGRMPPSPNTTRARVGAFLIRLMQRGLFWYTPAIVRFQNEVAHALSSAAALFDLQRQQIAAQEHEIRLLRGELVRMRGEKGTLATNPPAYGNGHVIPGLSPEPAGGVKNEFLESFLFANYDRLRGNEAETARKLNAHLVALNNVEIPDGEWLDLGCGRGEWIITASAAGVSCCGVDSNPLAVEYCHELGLDVIQEEAIHYLRRTPAQSVSVVTAFHVVEHLGASELLVLVQEAARVLKPGGLLSIETPDPANLLMSSHQFWRDPSHRHPIPISLMELIYDYFGLTVIERLHLNSPPAAERLPFDELDVVRRLNQHLYGPQDYGLIGRR